MAVLTLNLLGDLLLCRDGQPMALPPSRKTRALLAYLALNPRPVSREHLCELFWELPDDPRGSLRWSLSKLRHLVDTPERRRLDAGRTSVYLDTHDMEVDVLRLHRVVASELESGPLAWLEETASRYRGPFLEGLELPNAHDFHGWCLAEREGAARAQARLLWALVKRLAATPERALPHAQSLVRHSPFDEAARAQLVQLLLALHRPREADQQFQLGMRMLKEAGIAPSGALIHARRSGVNAQAPPHAMPDPLPAEVSAETPGEMSEGIDELTPEPNPEAKTVGLVGIEALVDGEAREVLQWAALLDLRIDAGALARFSGLDDRLITDALEAAERLGMLATGQQGLGFTASAQRSAVYQSISPTRRQVMHRRIAEMLAEAAIQDLDHAAQLAHHAQHSGDTLLATQAMVTAGRTCLRLLDNDQALRLANRGLELVEGLSGVRRPCLTIELREVRLNATSPDDWQSAAEELVVLAEQALEHGALAHARRGYHLASHLRWDHGQWAHAHEASLQSERVTRAADDPEQIIAMAETARCLAMLERDMQKARDMLAEAEHLAAARRLSHPALPLARGLLAWHDEHIGTAEAAFKEARVLCKASGDRIGEFQANEYLLMIAIEQGQYAQAANHSHALVALGERLRDGSEAPFASALQALCRLASDDDAHALAVTLPALRDADARYRLAWILNRAAMLHLERDRPASALPLAEEALEHARTLQRSSERLLAHGVLANALGTLGQTEAMALHVASVNALMADPVAGWARRKTIECLAANRDLPGIPEEGCPP